MRAPRACDFSLWILASDRAQVRFEVLKAHRCELLAFAWLRHGRTFGSKKKLRRFTAASPRRVFGMRDRSATDPRTDQVEEVPG